MKEEDYSGSLESMVWLRARTKSLNLEENSSQRNREICVGYSEEMGTLELIEIIDFIVRIYREDSTKIQLEKNKEIELPHTALIEIRDFSGS